jgi:hypothetical protein
VPGHAGVERRDDAPLAIVHGHRERAQAQLEFLLDVRVALVTDLVDEATQAARIGDRVRGVAPGAAPGEPGFQRGVVEAGEQHATHRCRVRRQARADAQRHGHHASHRYAQHIDDGWPVEHGHRAAVVQALGQLLDQRLGKVRELERAQATEAEFQDARAQRELATKRTHVAEMLQRQHEPSRCRPRESGARGDAREAQCRVLRVEGGQDRQAAGQRLHEVAALLERGRGGALAGARHLTPSLVIRRMVRNANRCALCAQSAHPRTGPGTS